MELFAAIGGAAFVVASLALGARLMLLARRTRGLPEFVLGAGLFSMGGVGYPLMAVAQQATGLGLELRLAFVVGNMVLTGLGMTGVCAFTWKVFHPGSRAVLAITPLVATAFAVCAAAQIANPGLIGALEGNHGPWRFSSYVGIVVMVWAGTEAFRYHLLLRKRMALGLADAVVADRFRLWGVSMYCAATISGTAMVLQEVFGIPINGTAIGHLVVGPLGLACSGTLWLAFLPPAFYLRRVQARATA